MTDPNFIPLCVMCGKIEQWVERHYPSFVSIQTNPNAEGVQASIVSTDPRARILLRDQLLEKKKRGVEVSPAEQNAFMWELFLFVGLGMVVIVGMALGIAWLVATYLSE